MGSRRRRDGPRAHEAPLCQRAGWFRQRPARRHAGGHGRRICPLHFQASRSQGARAIGDGQRCQETVAGPPRAPDCGLGPLAGPISAGEAQNGGFARRSGCGRPSFRLGIAAAREDGVGQAGCWSTGSASGIGGRGTGTAQTHRRGKQVGRAHSRDRSTRDAADSGRAIIRPDGRTANDLGLECHGISRHRAPRSGQGRDVRRNGWRAVEGPSRDPRPGLCDRRRACPGDGPRRAANEVTDARIPGGRFDRRRFRRAQGVGRVDPQAGRARIVARGGRSGDGRFGRRRLNREPDRAGPLPTQVVL